MPPEVGVVIAAAGKSERMGGSLPKQFRPLGGVPMLLRAIRPFLSHPEVVEVVAVLAPEQASSPPTWLAEIAGERLRIAAGGDTRLASVAAGVRSLRTGSLIVLVHDGARPYPTRNVIDTVIALAREGRAAVAAVPVFDTLKQASDTSAYGPAGSAAVLRTVPRANLWRAQTPQGFPRGLLERAIESAGDRNAATDEAQLVEALGETVVLVRDTVQNLKVTTEDDFRLAEAILSSAQ